MGDVTVIQNQNTASLQEKEAIVELASFFYRDQRTRLRNLLSLHTEKTVPRNHQCMGQPDVLQPLGCNLVFHSASNSPRNRTTVW